MKCSVTPLLLAAVLAGCAPPPPGAPPPDPAAVTGAAPPPAELTPPPPVIKPGADSLAKGLAAYENSQYKMSRTLLRSALDSGLDEPDQAVANKYLAFIACASSQLTVCKTHFRKVIAIDPEFKLSQTEAGHPVWGKAFRDVKAEQQKKKR